MKRKRLLLLGTVCCLLLFIAAACRKGGPVHIEPSPGTMPPENAQTAADAGKTEDNGPDCTLVRGDESSKAVTDAAVALRKTLEAMGLTVDLKTDWVKRGEEITRYPGEILIGRTNRPESIGRNASHGCIRMRVKDMEALFPAVPNGTKVAISGGPYGPLGWGRRTLREGDRGADVRQLQLRLMQRGLLWGGADGVFGPATRKAVVAARKELNLSPGDQADPALQERLGMILFE